MRMAPLRLRTFGMSLPPRDFKFALNDIDNVRQAFHFQFQFSLRVRGFSKLNAKFTLTADQSPSRAPRVSCGYQRCLKFSCVAAARGACVSTWLGEC